ncbi:hypothetical protein [Eubacterium sp.]|uniref:hypothetical protein n=1 Tax=Eubacterium sp. TaxID=142586 RepID=UPI002FCBA580
MADVKVRINSSGARQLLNSAAVQGELLKRAEKIKARADGMGSGKYTADVQPGKNRAHAMVKTTDIVSRASNANNNTLVKSLGAEKKR